MKHKSLIALLISGLLLLSACENKPSDVSEGDKPQSEAVSVTKSENTSSTDDKSTHGSLINDQSSEELSEEPSEASLPADVNLSKLYGTEYMLAKLGDSGKSALADKDGKLLTKFEYDSIYVAHCEPNGLIVLRKGKKHKVVDMELNTLTEGEYDRITGVALREYVVLKPIDSELSSLYGSDCKTKCDIPEFKEINFYSLGSAEVLCITAADGANSWYKIDKNDPLVFTPYDMDSAINKDYDKLIKVFNSFVTELKNDSRDGMKKYATADLINSYDAFVKNPDAEDNYAGRMVSYIKTLPLSKLYDVYPTDYSGLVYVINEKEGRYVCSFPMTEYFQEINEYATFHSYFTTVSDGKGGLLIDSLARREITERYGTTS